MKRDVYASAVEHLRFSADFCEATLECLKEAAPKKKKPVLRTLIAAACICLLTFATAFAASPRFRNVVIAVFAPGGKDVVDFSGMTENIFTAKEGVDGVSTHYIRLPKLFDFDYGVLFYPDGKPSQFYEITEDYQLRELTATTVDRMIEWEGDSYRMNFSYVVHKGHTCLGTAPDDGEDHGRMTYIRTTYDPDVVSVYLEKDTMDEIYPMLYNLRTGKLTDVLSDCDVNAVKGKISFVTYDRDFTRAYIQTVVETGFKKMKVLYVVDLLTNQLHAVEHPASDQLLPLESGLTLLNVVQDTIYAIDDQFAMTPLLSGIKDMREAAGEGLALGKTDDGKVAVVDLYRDRIVELKDMFWADGSYEALRRGKEGPIAIEVRDKENGTRFGFLDPDTQQLQLVGWESRYEKVTCGWLDNSRFGYICIDRTSGTEQYYLCLYEFAA